MLKKAIEVYISEEPHNLPYMIRKFGMRHPNSKIHRRNKRQRSIDSLYRVLIVLAQ